MLTNFLNQIGKGVQRFKLAIREQISKAFHSIRLHS